jgi:hypothetical protein
MIYDKVSYADFSYENLNKMNGLIALAYPEPRKSMSLFEVG